MKFKEFVLTVVLPEFDATSLCSLTMRYEKSVYHKIKTGYAFTPDMNDENVEKNDTWTFTQGSAILKMLYYNPSNLMFQQIPVRENSK